MNLLIVTQKVDIDDPILGFFHNWIIEFSKNFEKVSVICLEKGKFGLPKNVKVYSLGKESGTSRLVRVKRLFYISIKERKKYDVVFVHMNQIYIVLVGFMWRIWNKKIALWYTHKSVTLSLRVAEKITNIVFTASKESFRLRSNKKVVTDHGIDTDLFVPDYSKKKPNQFNILSVGRISSTKGLDLCIGALKILKDKDISARLNIVGSPVTQVDSEYYKSLQKLVKAYDLGKEVKFVGPVSNTQSVEYFQAADVFVHPSNTGSLDKVVLESMSCGTPVISSNDAAIRIISKFNSNFIFEKGNKKDLANKLDYFYRMKDDIHYLQEQVREEVIRNHNLENLVQNMSKVLYEK